MSGSDWRTWRAAMDEALYGEGGFYRSAGAPGRHFRTSAHVSPAWAEAVLRLAASVDDDLGNPADFTLVDMGAGGGELVGALAELAPARWRLVGVDVAPRPRALAPRVEWTDEVPAGFDGLLTAVEWLDVVPVDVVELTDAGPRLVEVDAAGNERVGAAPDGADRAWLARWWPLAETGDRAELGRTRDTAWTDVSSRLRRGAAVAVDYAADPRRDLAGTLTGYREGRQELPVPDGSMDLTAHVLFESLVATAQPGDDLRLLSQRQALQELGLSGARPAYSGDAMGYLGALSRAGEEAELLATGGLGAHRWLVVRRF